MVQGCVRFGCRTFQQLAWDLVSRCLCFPPKCFCFMLHNSGRRSVGCGKGPAVRSSDGCGGILLLQGAQPQRRASGERAEAHATGDDRHYRRDWRPSVLLPLLALIQGDCCQVRSSVISLAVFVGKSDQYIS